MRIAGGSVVPPLPGKFRNPPRPSLARIPVTAEARREEFRRLSRRWLPGFALVSRDDLLQARRAELQLTMPDATLLDAWLDLVRLNHRAVCQETVNEKTGGTLEAVEWVTDSRPGWIVPIPVGFAALSELHDPGTVAGARDPNLPFRFVESVYSIGQWISPHRLTNISDLLWEPFHDLTSGLYRCVNAYQIPSSFRVSHTH
jgi:CRISPR-associated protein Csy2